ncbi:hypothetical protein ACVQ9Z_07970 [Staphylococcus aureus]
MTTATQIEPAQHYTQPPRYTEARFVKTLKERSKIGRPSTYHDNQYDQKRNYVN